MPRKRLATAAWLLAVPAAVLGQGGPSPEPQQTAGIFGIWFPAAQPAGEDLPLTAEAAAAVAAAEAPALDACAPPGMPAMLATRHAVELVNEGDTIRMRFAEWDVTRTIYMRPGNGPPVRDHSPLGVSFGRWEGETLAVFTLYIDHPWFDDRGTPQSQDVTVLERYTFTGSATLEWRFTVTDPATFTQPVVRRGSMSRQPGEAIAARDCAAPAEL